MASKTTEDLAAEAADDGAPVGESEDIEPYDGATPVPAGGDDE